jgi:two-component system, cell cycle sensor histidine kinase and response regulator CckA
VEPPNTLRHRVAELEQQLAQSERLRLEERRYRQIFEMFPVGVAITRPGDLSFVEFNDAAAQGFGYTREEFSGLTLHDLEMVPDQAGIPEPTFSQQRSPISMKAWRMKTRTGEPRDVLMTTRPMEIAGEHVCCGILEDITRRRRAEEALADQLSITEAIAATAADAIFMSDSQRRLTFANPAAERIFGYSLEEFRGRALHDLVHYQREDGSPYPAAECPLCEVNLTGATLHDHQEVFFRKDGTPLHASVSNAPLMKDGRVIATVVVIRDITERELKERELRDANERVAEALATAGLGIWNVNFVTGEMTWDARMKALLGLAPDHELTWEQGMAFIHPEDRAHAAAILRRASHGKNEMQWEWRVVLRNGETRWQQSRGHFTRGASGTILSARGVTRDITDQKSAQEVRERFAAIIEGTEDAITSATPEGVLTSWNRGAEHLYGYSAAEMMGGTAARLLPPERAGESREFIARMLRGEPVHRCETERVTKDGRRLQVSITMSLMRNERGEIVGISAITRDVSREKLLEEKLRQAEKMEAIGQLAGGIAHDFNNLLTVINGYATLALMNASGTAAAAAMVPGYLKEIGAAGERATVLTRQLLAFSRKQMLQEHVLDINAVVDAMRPMLSRIIREDIECDTVLYPRLSAVRADPNQLEQVIMNLSVNAADSMPSGGRIVIETKNVTLDEAYSRQYPEAVPGDYVMLAVSDTGRGIEPAIIKRIFEPFFTTKPVGKGTGLGLSSVYGIVRQSGGHVTCYSEVDIGTTFRVYLPASSPAGTGTYPARQPEIESVRGTETILLVEDDAALRGYAANVLQGLGYTVYAAPDGKEALRIARLHRNKIDLLITDIVMPRMSGRELSQALAPLAAGMRVLYVSGYTDNAIVQKGVLEPGLHFLSKPFNPSQLSRKTREVLSAPLRPGSILLVAPEPGNSTELRAGLAGRGYDVAVALDRVEAVNLCQQAPVDLLVLDLKGADNENIETIRWCRHKIPNVQIVALSESNDVHFLPSAARSGVRSVLQKPVSPEMLVQVVRELIGG